MTPLSQDSKLTSKELEILQEIEKLSQRLGKQFEPLRSYIAQTELEYDSMEAFQTPQDTLENTSQNSLNLVKNSKPLFQENERYEVRKILGEGGMGLVHLVYDRLLEREVAQKQIKLKSNISGSLSEKQKQMLWRLTREASITAKLEHPNIVPLYEIQQKDSGEIQFTMRKIEGKTLRELLQQIQTGKEKYDERVLLSIYLKVCDAIAYSHSKGVVHRDLKPENIIVGEFGEVYVMDWGIAKRLSQKDDETKEIPLQSEKLEYRTRGGIGTPGYMAPEQMDSSNEITPQADIYSLGKLLRECFTLRSPLEEFNESVQSTQKYLKQKTATTSIKTKQKQIPKDIEAIILKATRTETSKRYHTVKELSADIQHYLQDFRVSVREYGMLELLYKFTKRNKKTFILIIATVAIIMGLFLYKQKLQYKENLEHHRKRLSYWLKELQEPEEGMKQRALLEINKMKEIEIWKELVQKMEEGVEYYLSNKRNTKQDEYYKTITEILGWLENEKTGSYLLNALKKMQKKLLQYDIENRPISDEQYMVILARALADSKSKGFLLDFYWIFIEMGDNSLFENGSKFAFKIILENEGGISNIDQIHCKNEIDYLVRGSIKHFSGYYDSAIKDYIQAIQINPTFAMPYLNLGIIKANKGDFDSAIKDFNQAIFLSPKYVKAYISRGTAKKGKNNFDDAIDDYSYAIFLNPKSFGAYSNRGVVKQFKNDFDGAIKDYTQAILLNPKSIISYTNRGLMKTKIGDFDGAIEDCTQAINLNPKSTQAYINRAVAKLCQNDFDGAIEDCTQAINLNPKSTQAYINRGIAKKEKGDLDGAFDDYSYAIFLNPEHSESYYNRANVKYRKNDLDGAIKDFNQAIFLNPKSAEAYNGRGAIKHTKGDLDGALEDFTQAINLNPKYAEAYNNRGVVKKEKGDLNGAIKDQTYAIFLNPKNSDAYNNRGNTKLSEGDIDGALEDFNLAITLNSRNFNAYSNRGIIRYIQKKFDLAIEDYNKAIILNPKNSDFYNNRGNAKKEIGDFDSAITDYNQSIVINPNASDPYSNRALVKYKKNDLDSAIEDCNQSIKLNKKNKYAYNIRGLAIHAKGNFKLAIEDFNQAIFLDPTFAYGYNNRGISKALSGETILAIEDFNQAIILDPKYIQAYYNRGFEREKNGEIDFAIEDYNKIIELEPKFYDAYNGRGYCKYLKEDIDSSILDYSKAIELNPIHSNSYYNRACAKIKKEDIISAIIDLETAFNLDPSLVEKSDNIQMFSKIFIEKAIFYYRQKSFENTKKILIFLQKYFQEYLEKNRIEKMLKQVEKDLEKLKKK